MLPKHRHVSDKFILWHRFVLWAVSVCLLTSCYLYQGNSDKISAANNLPRSDPKKHHGLNLKPVKAFKFTPAASYPNPFRPALQLPSEQANPYFLDIDHLYLRGVIHQYDANKQAQPYAAIVADPLGRTAKLVSKQKFNAGQWQVGLIADKYVIISEVKGQNKKYIGFKN